MSRVPRIRFKGFEEDWEQRKLGDIVREVTRVDENSNAPVMMITANDGFIEQSERYSTDNAGRSLKKYILLKKWELAYNHGASKIRPFGSCFALTRAANIRIPFVYHCFLALEDNPEFLEYTLNSKNVENQLRKIVSSGARMDGLLNISFQEYTSIFIRCPIRKEQDIIAILIKSLDHIITLHQSKSFGHILKVIVSCTLSWEQRKLGEVADIIGGGTPSTLNSDYWDGNIDWYSPAEIIDQIYVYRSQRKITELGFEKSSAKMLPEGTVLFTSRAGIGKTVILAKKGCTNQGFQSIVPYSNKLDSYFIFSRTEELKKYGELVGAGSTFVEVSGRQMENMQLMIPKTIGEQHIIGVLFSTFDHLITLHQLEPFQLIFKAIAYRIIDYAKSKPLNSTK